MKSPNSYSKSEKQIADYYTKNLPSCLTYQTRQLLQAIGSGLQHGLFSIGLKLLNYEDEKEKIQ